MNTYEDTSAPSLSPLLARRRRAPAFPRFSGTIQEQCPFPPPAAVIQMVFEKFIRYAGLAVGLKPSARGCEGRLRGLYPDYTISC